jgi:hypothetical protein
VYTVKKGSDVQTVEVTYDPYKDYFKTNDDELKAYAYGDSDNVPDSKAPVAVTVAAGTGTPSWVASGAAQLQNALTIDNTNHTIS